MDQFEKITEYLKEDFYLEKSCTANDVAAFITGIYDDLITENLMETGSSIRFRILSLKSNGSRAFIWSTV